jgi:hypothetical protein
MKTRIAMFVAAAWVMASLASAQNLLINGNFSNPNSDQAPTSWNLWSWPNDGNEWVNHQSDSSSEVPGTWYMAVGGSEWNSCSAGLYQIVSATAGDTYTLTVDSGAQAWWSPEGEMRLSFLDSSSDVLTQNVLVTVNYPAGDQGQPWATYSLAALAPAGTDQAKVEFAMNGGGGTVWFDNADLTAVPEPSTLGLVAFSLFASALIRRRK